MSKKASANMWWIIIGAVIALVVMIVLMVLFTEKSSTLEDGLSACDSKGGICYGGDYPPQGTLQTTVFSCSKQGELCYIGSPRDCSDVIGNLDQSKCSNTECMSYGLGKKKHYCSQKKKKKK